MAKQLFNESSGANVLDQKAFNREVGNLSLSTRLILLLTILIGSVMALGGWYILRQRVAILENATRNELRAHAVTLQIALEEAYRAGRPESVQQLINRLSEKPKVYSVILFDERGQVALLSNPAAPASLRVVPEIQQVMATGEMAELTQGLELLSIIMPIRLATGQRAAFEISQPTSYIATDRARARRDIVLITLALCVAVILVVTLTMRSYLLRPLYALLQGTKELSESGFAYRVPVPRGKHELAQLASGFNQMAAKLAEQRDAADRAAANELELERKLRQGERLTLVGRIAAGVAHELGAPLNVIKGRVGMVLAGVPQLPEKQQRNLTIINAQADAITHLVRQLLNLARPFQLQRHPLNLRQLAAEVYELVEADANKYGVRIELSITDQAWVLGDRKLLHQVLLNLFLNALHAMESGGGNLRLVIEKNADHKLKHAEGNQAGFTLLRIADSGPGIDPDNLERIFDPFFTTKEVGKGTGLGLSVARRIVEEHGGRIEAVNGTNGGAVFLLWLPSASAPSVSEAFSQHHNGAIT